MQDIYEEEVEIKTPDSLIFWSDFFLVTILVHTWVFICNGKGCLNLSDFGADIMHISVERS